MADTASLPIIPQPPYRRDTAARHRRTVAAWALERVARHAKAWLQQPIRISRGRHAAVAVGYSGLAVLVGTITAAAIR